MSPRDRRRTKRRTKKKPAKEVMVVDEDEDEEEGEQEKEEDLPTILDPALATAFSLNSASPSVAATAATLAQVQGPLVAARDDCGGTYARSLGATVVAWRSSPHCRRNAPASTLVRRQPQTITRM